MIYDDIIKITGLNFRFNDYTRKRFNLYNNYTIYKTFTVNLDKDSSGYLLFDIDKNEFENYIYFDWSRGKCAPALFDLGFPTSINEGFISSYIDDYDKDDACCCPSIKRKMKFTYDKEFNFLSLVNVESIKQ